ncbi:cupin domain-containing protein [Streptomyces sp. KR80]|uniref:cupin domain-containing protein n=1 Tax=Streptomyces sp. KR80 TaxID=3457426 RepID=UPI003FD16490
MTTPFGPLEHYSEGVTVEAANFPGSTISGAPFDATRIVVAPGAKSPVDQHAVTECWLVVTGSATMRRGDEEFELTAGDMVDIAPHVPHQVLNNSGEDFTFFSVYWNATGDA